MSKAKVFTTSAKYTCAVCHIPYENKKEAVVCLTKHETAFNKTVPKYEIGGKIEVTKFKETLHPGKTFKALVIKTRGKLFDLELLVEYLENTGYKERDDTEERHWIRAVCYSTLGDTFRDSPFAFHVNFTT